MSTNAYVVGGAVSIVLGAICTALILKVGPWMIRASLGEIVTKAVKEAMRDEVKALRGRVAELEHWRQLQTTNGEHPKG